MTGYGALVPLGVLTTRDTGPNGATDGASTLIWLGLTYEIGAENPPIETVTPPMLSGSAAPAGGADQLCVTGAKLYPVIEIQAPGATPGVYVHPSVTPPGAITGAEVTSSTLWLSC